MKNNIIGEINNKSMLTIFIHPLKIDFKLSILNCATKPPKM